MDGWLVGCVDILPYLVIQIYPFMALIMRMYTYYPDMKF